MHRPQVRPHGPCSTVSSLFKKSNPLALSSSTGQHATSSMAPNAPVVDRRNRKADDHVDEEALPQRLHHDLQTAARDEGWVIGMSLSRSCGVTV